MRRYTNSGIGEWEHMIVSSVKQFIPESVKRTWRDWRASMKKAAHETTGGDQLDKPVGMVGWGVEEADANYKKDASKFNALRPLLYTPGLLCWLTRATI
jgi:N-terminal acetyltransferase 2